MIKYNEAVQWLHDNPRQHKQVRLRDGTTATAIHCDLDVTTPIVLHIRGNKGISLRHPTGLCWRDEESDLDIVGFPIPEPEVAYRKTGGGWLFNEEEYAELSAEGRAIYSERVHVIPAPLDD